MAFKQIEGNELLTNAFEYSEIIASEDSEQNYSANEIDFDTDNNVDERTESETDEAGIDTGTINKNYRLLFAYYKDLNGEGLLSRRDEVVLSAQIKICKERAKEILEQLNTINSKKTYTKKTNVAYLQAKQKLFNDRALKIREKFIKSNLRFVIDLANRYQTRGLPLSDLIQEGNIGLMKAVEKFDHTKGFKFSTYSAWWIHQSLSRAIMEQTKVISIPVYLQEQASVVFKAKAKLEYNRDKAADSEEIALETGLSKDVVNTILRGRNLTVPLEVSGVDEDTKTYLDIISDPNSKKADYYIAENSMTKRVKRSLRQLSDRERDVIKMRFGIDYENPYKLEQIAVKYSLSRERIRQIETIALKKIADSEEGYILKEFLT